MAAHESNEFGRGLKTRRAAFEWERGGRITADTTLTLNSNQLQEYDASAGNMAIVFPASPYEGCSFLTSEIGLSANAVTIDGNGNNIDGNPTATVNTIRARRMWRFNGTEWNLLWSLN